MTKASWICLTIALFSIAGGTAQEVNLGAFVARQDLPPGTLPPAGPSAPPPEPSNPPPSNPPPPEPSNPAPSDTSPAPQPSDSGPPAPSATTSAGPPPDPNPISSSSSSQSSVSSSQSSSLVSTASSSSSSAGITDGGQITSSGSAGASSSSGVPNTITGSAAPFNTGNPQAGGSSSSLTSATIIPPPPVQSTASSTKGQAPAPTYTQNVTVPATDPQIVTTGGAWKTTNSSCNPSSQSKQCSVAGQKLNFTFVGTAVYMNTAQSSQSGMFSVSVDNSAPYTVDSFSNSTDAKCGISWSSPPLSNGTHTVIVTSLGQSSQADGQAGASTFELDGFTVSNVSSQPSAAQALARNLGHCLLAALFATILTMI